MEKAVLEEDSFKQSMSLGSPNRKRLRQTNIAPNALGWANRAKCLAGLNGIDFFIEPKPGKSITGN
jgi:hypothetical protein